jgi:glycosyltransferase involved in cell wall biosynthesis
MPKVLIVTYYWPPGSGAGVQRWLKFSKYLPSFGWEPVILTVDPESASYPAIDNTLENDIPEGVRVYKTKATDYFRFYKKDKSKIPSAGFANSDDSGLKAKVLRFIRGNFFIPDPRKGWNKYAFRKACEIIESEKIDHVITTSPPHSTQLIGLRLKKKYPGIKWVADLRDPWTDIYYYSMFYHTSPAKYIDSKLEKKVLSGADKIITVGRSLKELFSGKAEGLSGKIEVITNGYDEDDFSGMGNINKGIFTISYIGTLSEAYPLKGFLYSVASLRQNGKRVKLRFVGSVSPGRKNLILSNSVTEDVEFIDYVDHSTAIKYMKESSALLLIIPEHLSSKSILTGKLFEYIATGNPVICLGPPDGDAAETLTSSATGKTFNYNDISAITEFLGFLEDGGFSVGKAPVKDFSRRSLTRDLVMLLNEI